MPPVVTTIHDVVSYPGDRDTVFASDIGGLSEIVRHQQDGLLVPPGDVQALADAIICLLKDHQLYN